MRPTNFNTDPQHKIFEILSTVSEVKHAARKDRREDLPPTNRQKKNSKIKTSLAESASTSASSSEFV